MPDMETLSESVDGSRDIRLVTARVLEQLDQPHIAGEVSSAVESEFKRFDRARIRDFIPVFVERRVRANLRALAHA